MGTHSPFSLAVRCVPAVASAVTVFDAQSLAQQTLQALEQFILFMASDVEQREVEKDANGESDPWGGRKKEALAPLSTVHWGGEGSWRGPGKSRDGGVASQSLHTEARGTSSLSPLGTALLLALSVFPPSCPWALCLVPAVSPCSLSQRLAQAAMRSWGGVSWQALRSPLEPWQVHGRVLGLAPP